MTTNKILIDEEKNKISKEYVYIDTDIMDIIDLTEQKCINKFNDIIDEFENPYPKDIFLWNNKDKLDFNRGRFNEFTHSIVENMRKELKQKLNQNDNKTD